jgi:hypothetical protein
MYAIYSSQTKRQESNVEPCKSTTNGIVSVNQHRPSQKSVPGDKKLRVAIDDVLKQHQQKLPKRPPCHLHRRDSFSTITTAAGTPDSSLCHVSADERNGGFVPLEISFPTVDPQAFPRMPLLQKSKFVPDSRNVFDFYDEGGCDDIVFVPVEAEMASRTSSMKGIRKIPSFNSSDDDDETEEDARLKLPRPSLRRAPSEGMDAAGPPPLRIDMNEISFRIRRVEI